MGIQRDGRETNPTYWYVHGSGASWYERNRYYGAWYSLSAGDTVSLEVGILQGGIPYLGSSGPAGVVGSTIGDNGTFYCDIDLPADQGFSWRVNIRVNGHVSNTSQQFFTTLPAPAAFQNIVVGGVTLTSSAIDFSGEWAANTNSATGYASLYYKKVTDVGWTLHSSSGSVSGFGWNTFATTVSSLTAGTAYQFKLVVTRTTAANTSTESSVYNANTLASTPTVTTEAASSVSSGSGQLNGTIDANLLSTDCNFLWNKSALRTIAYNNGVNITATKVVVVGGITYTFKANSTASGSIAYSGQPTPGDTLTIGAATYAFVAAVAVAGDIFIGASADATFLNLTRAINNSGGTPGVGNDYLPYGGAANTDVSAVQATPNVNFTALLAGSVGNVAITKSCAVITITAMSGGADITGPYGVLIGASADATMQNLVFAVNDSGGVPGISYVVAGASPDVVATIDSINNIVSLTVPTNTNPTLTFTTTEATFTLDDTDREAPLSNSTTVQNFSNDGTTPFLQALSSLAAKRKYYYKAQAVYYANGGGTLYGTELSFTTSAVPLAAALEEDHMQIIQFDGRYNTAMKFNFTLRQPASASSDLFYTGAVPDHSTEAVILHTDSSGTVTAYASSLTNVFTKVGSYLFTVSLTAAEMSAEIVDVIVHSAGAAYRDTHIQIRTAQRISMVDIDATNGPTNASALTTIGNGTGDGISATSAGTGQDINAVLSSMWLRVAFAQTQGAPSGTKIKLDSNASNVDDYYNGCVVVTLGGFGAGQARVITAYNGGQKEATVDTAWSSIPDNTTTYAIGAGARPWALSPAAELASVPGPTAGYGAMLQLLFQRFAFKIDQTASAQTWYNSSGVAIFDRSVSDDGVTQTVEALANI